MKIVLTGASGFVGQIIQSSLAAQAPQCLSGRKATWAFFDSSPEPFDLLIHCGFDVDYRPYVSGQSSDNLKTTHAIVRFLKTSPQTKVLFLSAAGTLGVSETPTPRAENVFGLCDAPFQAYIDTRYIREKIESEKLFQATAPDRLAVFYLSTVIGPGMPPETTAVWRALWGKKPFFIYPPGGSSFLSVPDFQAALNLWLESQKSGRWVVSSQNATFREIFDTARSLAPKLSPKLGIALPKFAADKLSELGARGELKLLSPAVLKSTFGYKYYDSSNFQRDFHWSPKLSLKEAMSQALKDFRGSAG